MTGQQLLMVGLGTGCAVMACILPGSFPIMLGLAGGISAGLALIPLD